LSAGNLVTGATGFLGSALALELLARTDERVALLVRDSAVPPADRVVAALHRAAQDHGYPEDFVDRNRGRLDVVAGDLDADPTGAAPALGPVARAWHCAASLRYEDSHRDEIWHTNVEGTRKALELARRCSAAEFHHISTAYVAGTRKGIVPEVPVDAPAAAPTNNAYETSKVGGEQLVGAERAMRTRIYVRASWSGTATLGRPPATPASTASWAGWSGSAGWRSGAWASIPRGSRSVWSQTPVHR
jgi:nucleoside-diphosphate-sugar epimerase